MGSKKKHEKSLKSFVSPLHPAESWLYFCVTIATIAYLCYCVYRDSIKYDGILNIYDFRPGWNIIGREEDISNFEWHFWSGIFWVVWPWYLGHVALGKVMEWNFTQFRKYAFLVFSVLSLSAVMGWRPVCLIACHALLLYLSTLTGYQMIVWTVSLALLSTLNFEPFITFMKGIVEHSEDDTWYYLLMFTLALANIRCTSFCLEKCWNKPHSDNLVQLKEPSIPEHGSPDRINTQYNTHQVQYIGYSLVDMLCYIFYLPLFYTGPILTYDLFKSQMNAPIPAMTVSRVMSLTVNFIRVFFWAIFNELILHFFYFNSLQHSSALKTVSLFTVAGIGYCQGQFFMVKYLVMFGLPASVARVDNLDPPLGPKCISYIHLYSDMWKYIYIPCGGSQHGYARQILSSGMCFLYVFYWHGAEYYIALWILLNCVGISLESLGSVITKTAVIKKLETEVLSLAMVQRLHSVLAIPVFLISCFSIFCFFGGQVVGYIFFERLILEGTLTSYLTLVILIYCAIQNCIEVNRWQTRREKMKQT